MSDDERYLWDGSGEPDEEVRRLEEVLAPLRYDAPPPDMEPKRGPWLATAVATAAAVLLVVFGATRPDDAGNPHMEADAPFWAVGEVVGSAQIGGRTLTESDALRVGEWLETGEQSSVRLAVADIGSLQVGERTKLRIRKTGEGEHRVQLGRGRISARVDAPPRLFLVDTASATAVDLGCAYTLEVNERGDGELLVTSGSVALELGDDRQAIVPAGAMCRTRARLGPGTPFYTDAPRELREALTEIDSVPNCGNDAIRTVLDCARERDSLTLWHLFQRVPKPDRGAVFDRLNTLSAAPEGVTREGVLSLDRDVLDLWRDDLDWDW